MRRLKLVEENLRRMHNVGPAFIADAMRDKRAATSIYLDIKLGNLLSKGQAQALLDELLGRTIWQSQIMAHVKNGNIKAVRFGRSPFINKASLINAIQAGIFN